MRRFVALLVPLLLVAGCGGTATLDRARLERGIHHWALAKMPAGTDVHVSCPGDVPIKAGTTFHCLIRARGQVVRVAVTIENDKGYVTWVTD